MFVNPSDRQVSDLPFVLVMTVSFTGTGTPASAIPGAIPADGGIEPLPYTRMPLSDFARRLGLNPIHFAGATLPGKFPAVSCGSVWPRYSWQDESLLSHMDVALALHLAEEAIENYLGYHVAPGWRTEQHEYPRYKRLHRTNGVDASGRRPAIQLERGYVTGVGKRKQEFIGTRTVSYQDADGDGYNETAVVSLQSDLPAQEIAVYPTGFGYHPSWEIRHPRHFFRSGGTWSFLFDFWLMIDPELQARLPGEYRQFIDLTQNGTLLTEVDVYRVYNDETDTSAVEFAWEPAPGQEATTGRTTSGGLAYVRNADAGLVAPYWTGQCTLSPDTVKITYLSGVASRDYQDGRTLYPLDSHMATAVFYLAVARLQRDVCACTNAHSFAADLRTDMALVSPAGNFLAVADAIQTCPFGTRRGEWLAYQQLKLAEKHYVAAIV